MMESSGRIITWLLIAFGVKEVVLGLLQVYGCEPSNHSLYAEHPEVFPKEKLEDAARMVLEKDAKVESTAIRQMREEVKIWLNEKE
jgi:hypothetical protein